MPKTQQQQPTITGKGTVKRTGETVYAVLSRSEANRWHLVAVHADRLECDCVASHYGRICSHRKAVHARIVAERQAAAAGALAAIQPTMRPCDTAILYRDNKPFSLFR